MDLLSLLNAEFPSSSTPSVSTPSPTTSIPKKLELLPFLLDLLQSQQHTDVINWTGRMVGEFQFHDPERCAQLWGEHKQNKKDMNYDKLSRGLRFKYNENLFVKSGSQYKYRFITKAASNEEITVEDLKSKDPSPPTKRKRSTSTSDGASSSASNSPPTKRVAPAPVAVPVQVPVVPMLPVLTPEQLQQMQAWMATLQMAAVLGMMQSNNQQ